MNSNRVCSFVALKKSRKKPQPGQIFVYQLVAEPELFRYGMVVSLDNRENAPLVYFYRATSDQKLNIPVLAKDDLLIAPTILDDYIWKDGIFENVKKIELDESSVLKRHVFLNRVWDYNDLEKVEYVTVDEFGVESANEYENPSPYEAQTLIYLEETIPPLLGYESLFLIDPEPDFTTTEIEPEPYPELTAEQAETARELVTNFYNDLEKIARYYDDIDDTVVRENIAWILSHGFVWGEPVREPILNVGMFGKRGNERVGKALTDLFAAANASKVMASIPFGQARLDILQDVTIETKKGEPYDTFIGHSDKLHKYSELKDWLFEKYTPL